MPVSDNLAGAFYINSAIQVVSNTNVFQQCYLCNQGAIFSLIDTPIMTDTASQYLNNAALNGGVFYTDYSPVTLTGVTISKSYAVNGGVFYSYDKSPLIITGSTISSTVSQGQGGIGYFEENPAFNSLTDTFTVTIKSTSLTT